MPAIDVLDSTVFYEEARAGTPLVFLHGNPTSSYLWRHVLPRILAGQVLSGEASSQCSATPRLRR